MDIFYLTIKKELLKVFENNKKMKSYNEFLSKYRHDPDYVSNMEKKLNKPKEEIYHDCILFNQRINSYIIEASKESYNEIEEYNKTNNTNISLYGKEFLDAVSHKLSERLEEEKELY